MDIQVISLFFAVINNVAMTISEQVFIQSPGWPPASAN
jgi:hypothetical protein